MKEKTLLKIGLTGSLLGIIVLYMISNNLEIENTQIEKINAEKIEQTIKVSGEIASVNNLEKVAFVKLAKESKEYIDVVLFKDKDINLTKGEMITIEGSVEQYNDKLQIVANLIEK